MEGSHPWGTGLDDLINCLIIELRLLRCDYEIVTGARVAPSTGKARWSLPLTRALPVEYKRSCCPYKYETVYKLHVLFVSISVCHTNGVACLQVC